MIMQGHVYFELEKNRLQGIYNTRTYNASVVRARAYSAHSLVCVRIHTTRAHVRRLLVRARAYSAQFGVRARTYNTRARTTPS